MEIYQAVLMWNSPNDRNTETHTDYTCNGALKKAIESIYSFSEIEESDLINPLNQNARRFINEDGLDERAYLVDALEKAKEFLAIGRPVDGTDIHINLIKIDIDESKSPPVTTWLDEL